MEEFIAPGPPEAWPPASYAAATDREWLVTNGLGGYASSTICGANTRRYHGLFVPALTPPTGRHVVVSKVEETIVVNGTEHELGTNRFPGVIHPEGYRLLVSFRRRPIPEATFSAGAAQIQKAVWMRHGLNVSVIRYKNRGSTPVTLRLRPMLVCREYHHLRREDPAVSFDITDKGKGFLRLRIQPGATTFWMRFSDGRFHIRKDWYRTFLYDREAERGLEDREDAFCPGELIAEVPPGKALFLVFGLAREEVKGNPSKWRKAEIKRNKKIPPRGVSNAFLRDLSVSADQFLVRRGHGWSIVAGYPWFTDWGRDTMIAMRGLVIATGQQQIARSIFRTYLAHLDQGMLPNRFPDAGAVPEYNTIDATLWLFVALYEHIECFADDDFLAEVMPSLEEIVAWHQKGTRYGIGLTAEGLLAGGEEGVQLTWMDAKVDGHVVTPRQGCPVEINALWYNALCILKTFRVRRGDEVRDLDVIIRRTRRAFRSAFLHPEGYLYDVVASADRKDASIRPNMLYAVSLPFSPLNRMECTAVLDWTERLLYTDLGLRSLSPQDPRFQAVYAGDPWRRDHAYHQGTVWAFLWGEWALARLRIWKGDAARAEILRRMESLIDHFYHRDALHAVSEIFDGGQPGPGRGCIHQAWSVGMLLRVLLDPRVFADNEQVTD